jgi:hypothetical protein
MAWSAAQNETLTGLKHGFEFHNKHKIYVIYLISHIHIAKMERGD